MSGPYAVVFTNPARRAIMGKLSEDIAAAALNFNIAGPLRFEPHGVTKRLHTPLAGLHSVRRGTYRILCKIDDTSRTVTILDIRRRNVACRS